MGGGGPYIYPHPSWYALYRLFVRLKPRPATLSTFSPNYFKILYTFSYDMNICVYFFILVFLIFDRVTVLDEYDFASAIPAMSLIGLLSD